LRHTRYPEPVSLLRMPKRRRNDRHVPKRLAHPSYRESFARSRAQEQPPPPPPLNSRQLQSSSWSVKLLLGSRFHEHVVGRAIRLITRFPAQQRSNCTWKKSRVVTSRGVAIHRIDHLECDRIALFYPYAHRSQCGNRCADNDCAFGQEISWDKNCAHISSRWPLSPSPNGVGIYADKEICPLIVKEVKVRN